MSHKHRAAAFKLKTETPRLPERKRINLMEERPLSLTVSCHRAPPAGGQPPRDHACDLPFPILDFSTSWVFLWPPARLTNHWAAPRSPESLVVAPLQDQRKSLETAMETSVVLDGRFGEGVGAGLKQNVLEQQPVDYSGQTIAVIFPLAG